MARFGLLADVQYADSEDGPPSELTGWKYYRDAKRKLQNAVGEFNAAGDELSCVLQLGDVTTCLGIDAVFLFRSSVCLVRLLFPRTLLKLFPFTQKVAALPPLA